MISPEFLEEQPHATPFVGFVLILNSGDRYNVKTADHADLPPEDEKTGERNPKAEGRKAIALAGDLREGFHYRWITPECWTRL
jgi:hypothetical protein